MSNRQDIAFLTPFANDAETTLPGVPIDGTSYRDTTFSDLGPGWPYKTKVESQDFNQIMYIQTLLMRQLSNQGVLDYSDKEDYTADNALIKDDGGLYLCIANNGPASSIKQPSTEPLFWRRIDVNQVDNRFKGNQNWNVEGSTGDPLPTGAPTTYTVGAQVVAGVEVITTNAEQVTYVAGVLNSGNNTGILRRRYAKDSAGLITKSSQYGGIKLPDGSQLQALVDDIATNGVRITEDGSDVVVDVDLSVVTTGFRFFGLSDEPGAWDNINDDESKFAVHDDLIYRRKYVDVTGSRTAGVTYTNNTGTDIQLDMFVNGPGTRNLTITYPDSSVVVITKTNDSMQFFETIPDGASYSIDVAVSIWFELRV